MAIADLLEDVKTSIREMQRKNRFKRANESRAEAVNLQTDLAKCRGKLETCQKDFNRIIRNQSANIKEGKNSGIDTSIQEGMLKEAAIGYMLVRDAIFALKTISSDKSVSHAYEMLDAALIQMTKKQRVVSKLSRPWKKERNKYQYITSAEAVEAKEAMLDGFLTELIEGGDIEECLKDARDTAEISAERRSTYAEGKSSTRLSASSRRKTDAGELEGWAREGKRAAEEPDIDFDTFRQHQRQATPPKE